MNKFILSICISIFIWLSSCTNNTNNDPTSFFISFDKAKEDFKIFRKIIETAHPSLNSYLTPGRSAFLFDSIDATLTKRITIRNFYNKLWFLVNSIGCSHTEISLPGFFYDTLYNRKLFFPVPVLLVGDRLLVNSDYDLPPGTEILSVNDIPASMILDSLILYNPVEGFRRKTQKYLASTDWGFQFFMKNGGVNKFSVKIKDTSGVRKSITLDAINLDELYSRERNRYYYDGMDVDYSLIINDSLKTATLRLTTFEFNSDNKQNAFESFLKNSFELLKARKEIKSLTIDLRENTGGSLYNCFLLNSYLANKPFNEYKEVFTRIEFVPYEEFLSSSFTGNDLEKINTRLKNDFERAGVKRYHLKDSLLESWTPQKFSFSKNVYIITNWNVNSAASYFTLLARTTGGAKIVGFETAGGSNSGNGFVTIKYSLPNTGIEFAFPYVKLLYTNGEPFTGKGLIPDYIVPDTYESFKKNEDRQKNYIIDSLVGKH